MRLLILFVGCAFLAGGSKAQYPPSLATPRELGELVFSAIVNDDRAAYVALVMTDADCDSACARAHASDSAKAEVVEQMRGLARHVRGEANAVFDTLRMKGMQYGVEWATAQLIEVR